jgi:hypothetical protein
MRAEDQQHIQAPAETDGRITYQDWVRITGKDPLRNPPGETLVNSLVVCCKSVFALVCIAAAGATAWLGYTLVVTN